MRYCAANRLSTRVIWQHCTNGLGHSARAEHTQPGDKSHEEPNRAAERCDPLPPSASIRHRVTRKPPGRTPPPLRSKPAYDRAWHRRNSSPLTPTQQKSRPRRLLPLVLALLSLKGESLRRPLGVKKAGLLLHYRSVMVLLGHRQKEGEEEEEEEGWAAEQTYRGQPSRCRRVHEVYVCLCSAELGR